MPLKRFLAFSALLFLTAIPLARAADAPPSYVELADAPTISVDWSKGETQIVTIGGNRTLIFSNGQKGGKYVLVVKQDATGSRTLTWPSSVHWPGPRPSNSGPILTTTANKKDYFSFMYDGLSYDVLGFAQSL